MKTLEELIAERDRLNAEIETIEACEFKQGEKYFILYDEGRFIDRIWDNSDSDIQRLNRGRISKDRKTLEDKDRREIIETQLLKYEVKGGGFYLSYNQHQDKVSISAAQFSCFYGVIEMSKESGWHCINEMRRDDIIEYLTRGAV